MLEAPDAVLFDLDGTLVDTAADIAAALNHVLENEHQPLWSLEFLRPWVSRGAPNMLRHAFDLPVDHPRIADLAEQMLGFYRQNICHHSHLFEGMPEVLDSLEQQGIAWGVVTNKATFLAEPLLEELKVATRAGCIICGDTLPVKKPEPDPIYLACKQIGAPTAKTWMVGDDLRDIHAGQAAGSRTIAAAYGYLYGESDPTTWGADAIIHAPAEMRAWLT